MTDFVFGKLLLVLALMLLVFLLLRPDSSRIDYLTPVRVLKYGSRFRAFILLFAGPLLVFPVAALIENKNMDVADKISAALLALLSLYCFLETFLVRISFSHGGVIARSPWRRTREFAWTEFTSYRFSEINKWHLLETGGKGRLRMSVFLTGLESFFHELGEQNPDIPSLR